MVTFPTNFQKTPLPLDTILAIFISAWDTFERAMKRDTAMVTVSRTLERETFVSDRNNFVTKRICATTKSPTNNLVSRQAVVLHPSVYRFDSKFSFQCIHTCYSSSISGDHQHVRKILYRSQRVINSGQEGNFR